jgi:hypothetical protein
MIPLELRVYHIRFVLEAQTLVHMGAQAGAQIRGALWYALRDSACTDPSQAGRAEHSQYCPACYLLNLKTRSPRGQNPPRPFTVRPPLSVRAEEDRRFQTGECFEVELVLIGDTLHLFPYLVQALRGIGQKGVAYGRGRFSVEDIINYHPLTRKQVSLLDNQQVKMPSLAIQQAHINQFADLLPDAHIRLRFLTPLQLKDSGQIQKRPLFAPLIARMQERLQALVFHYTGMPPRSEQWKTQHLALQAAAKHIQRTQDNTRWVTVYSGSRRANRRHRISGLVGEVRYEGDLTPFQKLLLWGQSLHVGRNTIKGNGWYEISVDSTPPAFRAETDLS